MSENQEEKTPETASQPQGMQDSDTFNPVRKIKHKTQK